MKPIEEIEMKKEIEQRMLRATRAPEDHTGQVQIGDKPAYPLDDLQAYQIELKENAEKQSVFGSLVKIKSLLQACASSSRVQEVNN
ncbi:hypothetical protein MKW98_010206 [Papaver atlanticum]|uniref:Uncharacterized protein n=1 Tax=Papaver atlanticum TaxID=357466 RepID=A0AAD4SLQ0_9MAGN|nr:hypothetical protein MKW98_010206 [Papaver atlanticum]